MALSCFSKSAALRLHILSNNCIKSPFSVSAVFENALEKTRQFLRVFYGKQNTLSLDKFRPQHRLPVEFFEKSSGSVLKRRFAFYRPGLIKDVTSGWVKNSLAGTIGRKALSRGRGPVLCFTGFALASKPSLLTKDEEQESFAYLIRDSFCTLPWQNIGINIDKKCGFDRQFSIADLKIGDLLAKGSNAAVYSASFKDNVFSDVVADNADSLLNYSKSAASHVDKDDTNDKVETKKAFTETNNLLNGSKFIISHSEGDQEMKTIGLQNCSENNTSISPAKFDEFNLALKVMFNYSAESNAYAIWNAMNKETLPCIGEFYLGESDEYKVLRKQRLKPHPNVVEMYFSFADQIPLLPGAFLNFPAALPVRLLSDGHGRNMTLFLAMKRYDCSLQIYLQKEEIPSHTRLLLFTQLMEAIVHLQQCEIAHRDLKTDNILVDLSDGFASPKLAVADFGCCLEGLCLNYPSNEICKGGNMALMAPEVVNTHAGPFSHIDYSRSDLWTVGTLAYEIFGGENPFYTKNPCLKSSSYNENELPPLSPHSPTAVRRLVKDMLRLDPKQRPNPNFVATVCQVLLHAPPNLLLGTANTDQAPTNGTMDWLFNMSAKTFLEASVGESSSRSLEFELRHTLCSRIQYLEVMEAIRYIVES